MGVMHGTLARASLDILWKELRIAMAIARTLVRKARKPRRGPVQSSKRERQEENGNVMGSEI